jgi:hypothetical protein
VPGERWREPPESGLDVAKGRCSNCTAIALVFSMMEIVYQSLDSYELIGEMDVAVVAEFREKIARYIDKLTSAGLTGRHRLTG